jgi:hypothetical protein
VTEDKDGGIDTTVQEIGPTRSPSHSFLPCLYQVRASSSFLTGLPVLASLASHPTTWCSLKQPCLKQKNPNSHTPLHTVQWLPSVPLETPQQGIPSCAGLPQLSLHASLSLLHTHPAFSHTGCSPDFTSSTHSPFVQGTLPASKRWLL